MERNEEYNCTVGEGGMENEARFWVVCILGAKTNIKTRSHAKQKTLLSCVSLTSDNKISFSKDFTVTHKHTVKIHLATSSPWNTVTEGSQVPRSAWWKSQVPIPQWAQSLLSSPPVLINDHYRIHRVTVHLMSTIYTEPASLWNTVLGDNAGTE